MNAVIQCVIRTPFFGSYLEQENFADAHGDQLLVEEIARIYIKSKTNSHASINTKPFKRLFEKHCPYFEGNSQHDSQEFLICLLERLMEEINSKREEFGISSQVAKRSSLEEDKNANKKVVKFFSGKTEAVTVCKKCRNKGVRVESFFTYSLSLP
jgi:ubiquitin carboxyl-terminal hydrolase 31